MIPILYEKTETAFNSNGICRLPDMIAGKVTEERNGMFIAEFEYPVEGRYFSEIKIGRIIWCSCSQGRKQPFEIYESSKPINGRVIFYARHLTYRANFIPVTPFTATGVSATDALNALKTNAMISCDFTMESTILTLNTYKQNEVAPLRGRLGGVEGSILDVWGGEYEWDYDFTNQRPKIKLWQNRGQNTGVQIRYGKNLTDLKQDESIENMITGVVLYYKDDVQCIYSDVKQRDVGGQYTTMPRIGIIDVTGDYPETVPTKAQLNAKAETYLNNHDIGIPKISLDVSFVNLADTEEYKNVAVLERVQLCDTVTVEFEKLGVNATAKVVKTVWDFLNDRYESIELGNSRTNISSVIVEQDNVIKNEVPSTVDMQSAIDAATRRITGNNGGYVVIKSTETGYPEEILIMNSPDKDLATAVWRWNQAGLGFSKSYSAMSYPLAMTVDNEGNGYINADFITAGQMSGDRIIANTLNGDRIEGASITAGKIAGGTITGDKIAGTTITGGNLADGCISAAKINAGAVTAAKLDTYALYVNGLPLAGATYDCRSTWDNGGSLISWGSEMSRSSAMSTSLAAFANVVIFPSMIVVNGALFIDPNKAVTAETHLFSINGYNINGAGGEIVTMGIRYGGDTLKVFRATNYTSSIGVYIIDSIGSSASSTPRRFDFYFVLPTRKL